MSDNKSMIDLVDSLDMMQIVYVDYENGHVVAWNGSSSFHIYYVTSDYWGLDDMFTHYGCNNLEHAKQIAIDHKKMMDEIDNEE